MGKRSRIVAIRLSEEEFAHLKEQAAKCTIKVEPMLRNIIAGLELHTRPCDHHPALLKALSDISNDTDQLLRTLHANGQLTEDECNLLKKRINDCWEVISGKY